MYWPPFWQSADSDVEDKLRTASDRVTRAPWGKTSRDAQKTDKNMPRNRYETRRGAIGISKYSTFQGFQPKTKNVFFYRHEN